MSPIRIAVVAILALAVSAPALANTHRQRAADRERAAVEALNQRSLDQARAGQSATAAPAAAPATPSAPAPRARPAQPRRPAM